MNELILIANQYREQMLSTNLYTLDNVYNIDGEKFNKVVSSVGESIIGGSFDFSNSILGRLVLPNTPIQQIGNRELAKALAKRVSSQLLQNVVGSVNFRTGTLNEPNYWSITKTTLVNDDNTINFKGILDTLFGYQSMSDPLNGDYSNQNLIDSLGKGTKEIFEKSIKDNNFVINSTPYSMGKGELSPLNDGDGILDSNKSDEILNYYITESSSVVDGYPTNNGLGDVNRIGNVLNYDALAYNTKHKDVDGMWVYDPQSDGSGLASKGSGVLNANNRFCRTWNLNKRYSTYKELMKFDNTKNLNLKLNTVQGKSILPNIHPDRDSVKKNGYVKNLMFSFENLAYSSPELKATLKPQEVGKYGRIMWFPPYNLQMTESVSPKTNSTDMIGRNEPIYTYNGVERTFNISFSLIVDSPSEIRGFEDTNNEFARLFSGCKVSLKNTQQGLSENDKKDIKLKILELSKPNKTVTAPSVTNPFPKNNGMKFYYSNDKYIYGNDINGPIEDDQNKTGEKSNINFINNIDVLVKFMLTDEGRDNFKIVFRGYASKLNDAPYNKVLGYLRAYSVYNEVVNRIKGNDTQGFYDDNTLNFSVQINPKTNKAVVPSDRVTIKTYENSRIRIETYGESKAQNANSTKLTLNEDVVDRYCEVYLEKTVANIKKADAPDNEISKANQEEIKRLEGILATNNLSNSNNDEFYFEKLKKSDPLVFNMFKDKVKYYSPVFNSQTPEDFNRRLVFLHQCTRQGASQSLDVDNSIFGKPPVSILRIGDFFHSRVIINSLVINYEPLIWDLNPEGIGIQPMLANVTMDVYVLGGQDLEGPMNKLLNALDYNFYANTRMYEQKAASVANSFFKTDNGILDRYDINKTITDVISTPEVPKSQIDRASLSNLSNQPSLSTLGADKGNNKISYNTNLEFQVSVLDNWNQFIAGIPDNYKKYLENGLLKNNAFIAGEKPNKSEMDNFVKISGELAQISRRYNAYNTQSVVFSGSDNGKFLIQDAEFAKFNAIFQSMEDFKNNLDGSLARNSNKIYKEIKKLGDLTYSTINIQLP